MDLWETITANSTLSSGDAWEHLQAQESGGVASAQQIAAAVMGFQVEDGLSVTHTLRQLMAVNAGNATGLDSPAPTFYSPDGVTVRVRAITANGDRTIIERTL